MTFLEVSFKILMMNDINTPQITSDVDGKVLRGFLMTFIFADNQLTLFFTGGGGGGIPPIGFFLITFVLFKVDV